MEESRHQHQVERRLKEAIKLDRARIQVGRISHFGLLELSRQRLRPSVAEASTEVCPHCGGSGMLRSTESTALHVLRAIEDEGTKKRSAEISLVVPTAVAFYQLNQKRAALLDIEKRYGFIVTITADHNLIPPAFRLTQTRGLSGVTQTNDQPDEESSAPLQSDGPTSLPTGEGESGNNRRRRRRRRGKRNDAPQMENLADASVTVTPADFDRSGDDDSEEMSASDSEISADDTVEGMSPVESPNGDNGQDEQRRKRRRRGRRGGRRRNRPENGEDTNDQGLPEHQEPWSPPLSSLPEGLLPSSSDTMPENPLPGPDEWPTPVNPSRTRRRSRPSRSDSPVTSDEETQPHSTQDPIDESASADNSNDSSQEENSPSSRRGWWKRLVT